MKKTIKLAVVAALALGATSAFATNGSALIGMGAKSRGMAGTSIGISHGAESALSNPALITSIQATEISFGGTLFMPDVNTNIGGAGAPTSDADMNVIPEVSLATKINENFYVGIGMWGTAGMGVDYRDATAPATNFNMVTNLQLMQFGVPLAYKMNNFSIAVTPILQYGALDIMYDASSLGVNVSTKGIAQDLKFGYNIGLSYEITGLTIGAVYKSEIEMDYKGQISQAILDFTGNPNGSDKLSTPAEIGVGVSYTMKEHTVALDYKRIKWSDAAGYKDFKWDDQNVIALGYEYKTKGWAARIGYNYAKSPISDQNIPVAVGGAIGTAGGDYGDTLDILNLLGFPGIEESHYAIGGTYNISKQTSVDLAFTYAPEVTQSAVIASSLGGSIETKHSQTGVSAQLNYAF